MFSNFVRFNLSAACIRVVFLAAFCLALTGARFNDELPPEELARAMLSEMSDEEALAQTFMLGWRDSNGSPSELILEWIKKRRIGAVKVFGWNTNDVKFLAKNIGNFQKLALESGIPLLVATDQEGGLVRHVRGDSSKTPGAMAIGASGFPEDAYRSGYYIGRELALLGINMNFAPSVDLFTNHDSLLIGPRSFGDDPVKAGIFGEAFARGQLAAGIIPTAKHFPGHGDTALDSHGVLPFINVDFETLWKRELIPYRMLAKAGIPAIMSGHIAFPKTKAGREPASLSSYFLNEVLRERIGFKGLIVTDDLAMNGATAGAGSLSQAAKTAILAGNDIIMISQTPSLDAPVWTALVDSMRNDGNFREKTRRAALRVLETKLKYLRGPNAARSVPNPALIETGLPDKEGASFFLDLSARSVTVVGAKEGVIPLPASKAGKVLLVAGNAGETDDQRVQNFFKAGRIAYPGAPRAWWNAMQRGAVLNMARECSVILFYLEKKDDLDMLNAFRGLGKRVIVLSVLSPSNLNQIDWVDAKIAVYNDSWGSLLAGFSVICGTIDAQGKLPFSF
ncbi:MAG: glycoside hydrolase family 3 protein [Spirochaetaceae bacterium]|nr:glycoside hydrolase family 3 protein [Spirochaetaceae bacterium]